MIKLKTSPQRSALMSKVKQKGTLPEIVVRSILKSLGHDFKTNGHHLPGSPDIYDQKRKIAVFIHGCFWHRHLNCKACTTPKQNYLFWKEKFRVNVSRDRRKSRELRKIGYSVHRIWECQAKHKAKSSQLVQRLDRIFGYRNSSHSGFIDV